MQDATPAAPHYIVASSISSHLPEADPYDWVPPTMIRLGWFRSLKPEFGFTITTWSPGSPADVRVIDWNTREVRNASPLGEVGRITIRAATPQERRVGEAQHAEAEVRA